MSRAIGIRRSIRTMLAAVALVAGSMVFASAPAFAGYSFVGSFGSAGSGAGQFSGPARLAVEAATGDVLVLDEGNRRVEKFGPGGEYLLELNGAGAPVLFSEADELSGLAVDNSGGVSGGDVYVATGNSNSNAGSTFVDRFRPGGGGYEYACRLTGPGGGCSPPGAIASEKFKYSVASVAVSPGGEVYVLQGDFGEGPKDVVEFNAAGEYVASLESPLLSSGFGFDIAVDPTGRVLYVVNAESDVVKLTLNAAGDAIESETAFDTTGEPYAVAVEPTTGDVFVVDNAGGTHVSVYNPGGELLEEFGKGEIGGSIGVAYSPFNKEVYVTDGANRVDVFERELPGVTTTAASAVVATGATLNGTLATSGKNASYYFKYGTVKGALTSKSAEAELVDSAAEPVSERVGGLTPDTTYYFRLLASNENGSVEGEEESFTTPLPAPSATVSGASGVVAGAATVAGAAGPNGVPVSVCAFEYGLTSALGSSAACSPSPGASETPVVVTAGLSGLAPGSTYYYRLAVTTAGGTTYSPLEALTTAPGIDGTAFA
jgi:hypothetical protein